MLEEGDQNSAFFHQSIMSRQAYNHIHYLMDDADVVLDTKESITRHFVGYYENLLGGYTSVTTTTLEEISSLVSFRCGETETRILSTDVSPLEIQKAFFSLPKNKSPGPDGYPAEFFTL